MQLQILKRDSQTVFDLNLLNEKLINAGYKNYNDFKKYVYKKEATKRYFNTCKYNQCAILKEFINLLYERFKNDLLIDTSYQNKTIVYDFNNNKRKYIYFNDSYCYLNFTINNFHYYIQFDENPFFDSSYINCDRIYLLNSDYYIHYKNRFYVYPSYSNSFNINNLFDIYNKKLDIKEASKKLFNYFINNIYRIQTKLIPAVYDGRYKRGFNIRFIDSKVEYLNITK